jgi:hypothetical protein
MRNTLLILLFATISYCGYAQPQIITTGNNVMSTTNPLAADIVIGSNGNGGVRHDGNMLWWSNANASRISNTADVFYLAVWNSTNPNVALAAGVGGPSYFQGALGVGITNPQTSLHVTGSGTSIDATQQYTGGGIIVQGYTGARSATTGAQLEFVIPGNTDGTNPWGQARIITVAGNSNNGDATGKMILGTRRYYNKLGTGTAWYYGNDLTINGNGNVIIGQASQFNPAYILDVFGTERANQIVVNASGADFVFDPAYKLHPLSFVKKYIEQNHHLPEIPSAKQMRTDGLNLGDNQMKLLQKVEELTLYTIAADKKIEDAAAIVTQQNTQLLQQQAQLKAQQAQIDALNKKMELVLNTITNK